MGHPPSDTIIACASAPGRSDRAIVRVSGPAVGTLIQRHLSPHPPTRGIAPCAFSLDSLPCPVLAGTATAPATFTGEDTLELLLPGNPHLVERLIGACCAHEGVRRAGPGEFSARAYLNGRLSLDEAEGIAALIGARTADDLDAARRLAMGQTGGVYRTWAEELATLLALVEAGIDFVDQEDVIPIAPPDLRARLLALAEAMTARASGELAAQTDGAPPLVVLVGSPNAGKSTLFNALLGRARSVVADEAGTTRDVLIERLDLDAAAGPGLAVRLADLPGLDPPPPSGAGGPPASAPPRQEGERSSPLPAQPIALDTIGLADAIIHCDPLGRFDRHADLCPSTTPVLHVRTKADRPGGGSGDIAVCALDGWHLDLVRRGIADIAVRAPGGSCSVALARHAREIAPAAADLRGAAERIDPRAHILHEPEILADTLRRALDGLESVLGRVSPDEVLGRVFATFCVGK